VTTFPLRESFWPADERLELLREPIGTVLRERAGQLGSHAALMWPAGDAVARMSYVELLTASERVARALLETAAPGDRVAVWSRNSVEWVVLLHACALAGLILTPFNTAWTDYEVEHAVALTEPRMIFVGDDTRGDDLLGRAQEIGGSAVVRPLGELLTSPDGECILPTLTADAPFLIQFTSGTTGRAKGALLSHRAALNSGHVRSANGHADEHDVWLNPVPLHHIGGSCILVLGALAAGGAYVVMERFDVAEQIRLLGPTRATRVGGVPTMVLALLDHPDVADARHQIVSVALGGAGVPPSLVERVRNELHAVPAIGYGQSECPMVTNTEESDDAITIATTVGRPAPHSTVKIVDRVTGATLPIDTIGEVCARSPLVMDCYYAMPDATGEVIDFDGFLHTGDLGSMDDRGVVTIHGRAREVIIRGGENIYPIEVEDALLQHHAVASVAVVGIPDDRWGQSVGAVIQLAPGADATPDELGEFAASRVAHFKLPRRWHFVEQMPLTASGKIRKVELEELFLPAAETAATRRAE
jgi:fatty-acyl-CoA synthase